MFFSSFGKKGKMRAVDRRNQSERGQKTRRESARRQKKESNCWVQARTLFLKEKPLGVQWWFCGGP